MSSPLFSRRRVLLGSGAIVLAAAGGVTWRAADQDLFSPTDGPAFAAWQAWTSEPAGPEDLVAAAVLAANAHNTQPWIFRMSSDRIDLYVDDRRDIGAVDPLQRELHLSLGCALENLVLAAGAAGYRSSVRLLPDPAQPNLIAQVRLAKGRTADRADPYAGLYHQIPHRHTNRHPYRPEPPSPDTLTTLSRLVDDDHVRVHWLTGPAKDPLGDLLVDANVAINADREQAYDNALRWLRYDHHEIEQHQDGLTLATLGVSALERNLAAFLPRPSLESIATDAGPSERASVDSAPTLAVITVQNDRDNGLRLRAGRAWQRLHLAITAHGLAAQPLNQVHERVDRERQLGLPPTFESRLSRMLETNRAPVFAFRLGTPSETALPSPRRPGSAVSKAS